jgi:hypothetical protein
MKVMMKLYVQTLCKCLFILISQTKFGYIFRYLVNEDVGR